MNNIYSLTTEGDCEGRTTRQVGIFKGTPEQILTYCKQNNIKPYYNFSLMKINMVDASNVEPTVTIRFDSYGRIYTEDL